MSTHANLAHTLYRLEALRAAPLDGDDSGALARRYEQERALFEDAEALSLAIRARQRITATAELRRLELLEDQSDDAKAVA